MSKETHPRNVLCLRGKSSFLCVFAGISIATIKGFSLSPIMPCVRSPDCNWESNSGNLQKANTDTLWMASTNHHLPLNLLVLFNDSSSLTMIHWNFIVEQWFKILLLVWGVVQRLFAVISLITCFAYYVKQGQVLMKRPLNVVSQKSWKDSCDICNVHDTISVTLRDITLKMVSRMGKLPKITRDMVIWLEVSFNLIPFLFHSPRYDPPFARIWNT